MSDVRYVQTKRIPGHPFVFVRNLQSNSRVDLGRGISRPRDRRFKEKNILASALTKEQTGVWASLMSSGHSLNFQGNPRAKGGRWSLMEAAGRSSVLVHLLNRPLCLVGQLLLLIAPVRKLACDPVDIRTRSAFDESVRLMPI
jgi:hypothetical protein